MTKTLEESNAELRNAVATRISNVKNGKPSEQWYEEPGAQKEIAVAPQTVAAIMTEPKQRPGSVAFMDVLEELRAVHIKKSQDYGEPTDALANIRAGADVVGIEPWRGCIIRIADKMQRIRSYCRDGKLANESFEDALLDLASYAIIGLIMFRGNRKPDPVQ